MRSALEVTGAWIEVWSQTLWAWIWAWIWALARWAWIWAPLLVPSVLVAPSALAEPPTVDYLALRLRQARERVPHLRVIAADNMPGECFTIDLDNKVIYFDALA